MHRLYWSAIALFALMFPATLAQAPWSERGDLTHLDKSFLLTPAEAQRNVGTPALARQPAQKAIAGVVTDLKGGQSSVSELAAEYESKGFMSQNGVRVPSNRYGLQTFEIQFDVKEGYLKGSDKIAIALGDLRLVTFDGWETDLACRPKAARFEKRDGSFVMLAKDPSSSNAIRLEEKDAAGAIRRSYTLETFGYRFQSGVDLLVGFKGRGRLSTGADAEFNIPCQQVRSIELQ